MVGHAGTALGLDGRTLASALGIAGSMASGIIEYLAEGTVHRLWEPLAHKQHPANAYAAKFGVPFAIAVAVVDAAAGLEQFSDARTRDPRAIAVAERVGYRIAPDDGHPTNYSGHLEVTLRGGGARTFRQPHLRGGRREPLTDTELDAKFEANARFGGWSQSRIRAARQCIGVLLGSAGSIDLTPLRG